MMVALVTGNGLGLLGGSSSVLGSSGQWGLSGLGQGNETVTVNAKTGNLILQRQDELLIGRGPDIGIVRTYNSKATFDFDNNDGWQLSLYRQLDTLTGTLNTAGSTITRTGADGSRLLYTYNTTRGCYINKDGSGAYSTLTYHSGNNSWTWSDGTNTHTETYQQSTTGKWRITQIADHDGNALTYTYNSNGLITLITDANGEKTRLNYDTATSRLSSIQQELAGGTITTRTRYTYDTQGRLSQVTTDLTPEDSNITDGRTFTTTYTYDGTSTRIATITNSDGTRLSITYDTQGRVKTLTDGLGQVTTLTYGAGNTTTVTDPLGNSSTLTYDDQGNLTRQQGPAGSGQDISYTYNANGDLTQLTDSRGNTITTTYDDRGNLTRQQDSAGNVRTYTYNNSNQRLTETNYTLADPDANGPLQAQSPQTTHYLYGTNQHLRFIISPQGRVTEYRYNAQGQQTSSLSYTAGYFTVGQTTPTESQLASWAASQDKTGLQRIDTAYDARGLVGSVTRYAKTNSDGAGITDGSQSVTHYIYDSTGRLLQQIDPRGTSTATANDYLTAYAYDGLGRILSITQYDATGTNNRQTLTTYHDALNRIEVTLANGLKQISSYDARGLLISRMECNGTDTLSAISYQYDANGRLGTVTDPNGNQTYYLYDSAGRKTGQIDATGALTEYTYNQSGQLTQTIRYATPVTANLASLFAADGQGLIPTVAIGTLRPATHSNDRHSWNIYDEAGRLTFSIGEAGNVTENRYDGTGQLLSTTAYANNLTNWQSLSGFNREILAADLGLNASAADRTTRYFYDTDGLLLGTLDGEGALTTTTYDAAGRLTQSTRYATNVPESQWANSNLATLVSLANTQAANNLVAYAYYNGLGQLLGELDAEGYYTSHTYDPAGNKTQSTRYANRLVGSPVSGTPPQLLTSAPGTSPQGGYVLINQSQDQTSRATWTAYNQIDTETAINGTVTRYNYDPMGHGISAIVADGTAEARQTQVRYDLQGRLIQELSVIGCQKLAALGANPSQPQIDAIWNSYGITHSYDAAGQRIKSVNANGGTVLYFYDEVGRLTHTVTLVRNPSNPNNAAEWLGEVNERQFNALGELTAEIRYANRITAANVATLTGGDNGQLTGKIVADTHQDSRTDYQSTINVTGGLTQTSTTKVNASQSIISTIISNLFGEKIEQQSEYTNLFTFYDRRGQVVKTTQQGRLSAQSTTQRIEYDTFGRIIRTTDANGNLSTATYDKLGRQIQSITASGILNITRSNTYDAFGRTLTQTDALGKTTTYSYHTDQATGKTTLTTTTPESVVTKVITDRYGQTVTVMDGLGHETRSAYDANGQLISVKRWDKTSGTETLIEQHAYDVLGNLIETKDANGNKLVYAFDAANRMLSRRVDPDGLNLTTTYAYDAKGQQVSLTDPRGIVTQTTYDLAGQAIEVAIDPDGLNLRTHTTYDNVGQQVRIREGYGTASERITDYVYDDLGRRIQTIVDPDGLKLTTVYTYDANHNVTAKTLAAGTDQACTTRYTYDADNRLTHTIDALGQVIKNTYDQAGRLIQSTAYAQGINLAGLDANATPAIIDARLNPGSQDRITRYAYNSDGQLRFTINALGAVTETQYDKAGQVIKTIAYANLLQGTLNPGSAPAIVTTAGTGAYVLSSTMDRITTQTYDALGQVISRTQASGTSIAQTETYAYDGVGNLIRHTDARGNRETFAYDAANRQIRHIDQAGYVTQTTWSASSQKLSETYYVNAVSLNATDDHWAKAGHAPNPVANTNATNGDRTLRITYDAAGRVVSQTNAAGVTTRTTYDALSNITDIIEADGTTQAVIVHRNYDQLGRMVKEIRALGTDQAMSVAYTYDALGNQISVTEAEGTASERITRQEFDLLGRKTAVIDANGAKTSTGYNRFGEIIKVTDAAGHQAYFYTDALGRVTLQVDPEGAVIETRYDALGNTTEIIRYAGKVVGTVSENSRPQIVSSAGTSPYVIKSDTLDQRQQVFYDVLGRKLEIRSWWGTGLVNYYSETFTYDRNNNVLTAKGKNDAVTTYEYDARNLKTKETLPVTSKNSQGLATAVENRFSYDALGNQVQKIEAYGLPEQRITTYTYDKLNRLIKESGEAMTVFNPGTRTESTVTPVKQTLYDARGNVIEEIDARGNRTLHYYDTFNRKIGKVDANGVYTQITYDAIGNKVSEITYANKVALAGGSTLSATQVPVLTGSIPGSGAYLIVDSMNDRLVSYTYDAMGRQIESRIDRIMQGAFHPEVGGGQYQIITGDITTRTFYDALGNITKQIDANGNVTRFYYNKAGQKVAQLDAKGYLTTWKQDSYGNTVEERQYATKVKAALITILSDTTTLAEILANVSSSNDDRVTVKVYDRLNRLTSEARKNVAAGDVNQANGALTEKVADATTVYVYDGLNHVIRQTDANGAMTERVYDGLGRQTREQKASYVDYQGNLVRPTSDTEYDGIGNVRREIERGTNVSSDAGSRMTTYSYGKNGYLTGQTDAVGNVTTYGLDANGNVTRQTLLNRLSAAGVSVNDVNFIHYDGANRQVKSEKGVEKSGSLSILMSEEVRYNAFGEVTGKRTGNGESVGGTDLPWQEFAEYDRAGRAWKSNSGSGVTKVYLFDANGNATLSVESTGKNLATMTLAEIMALSDNKMTISVYDQRNQLTDSYEPTMEATHELAAIVANNSNQSIYVGEGQLIRIEADASTADLLITNPIQSGGIEVQSQNIRFYGQPVQATSLLVGYRLAGTKGALSWANVSPSMAGGSPQAGSFTLDWQSLGLGGRDWEVQYYAIDASGAIVNKQAGSLNLTKTSAPTVSQNNGALGGIGGAGRGILDTNGTLNLTELGNTTKSVLVKYRIQGSNTPWISVTANKHPTITGWFSISMGTTFAANTNYEIDIVANDGNGERVKHVSGVVNRNGAGIIAFAAERSPSIIHITERTATELIEISYRKKGSKDSYTEIRLDPNTAGSGKFDWDASSLVVDHTQNYDYEIVLCAYGKSGLLLGQTRIVLRLGADPLIYSSQAEKIPPALIITPQEKGTSSISLGYL